MTDQTLLPVAPVFRAAEIALIAIKQNRCNTWGELVSSGKDSRLTEEQLGLVNDHMFMVQHLQVTRGEPITITWCPGCGRIAYVGAGTTPAKCTLTLGCEVKPLKAGAPAPRVKADGSAAAPESETASYE